MPPAASRPDPPARPPDGDRHTTLPVHRHEYRPARPLWARLHHETRCGAGPSVLDRGVRASKCCRGGYACAKLLPPYGGGPRWWVLSPHPNLLPQGGRRTDCGCPAGSLLSHDLQIHLGGLAPLFAFEAAALRRGVLIVAPDGDGDVSFVGDQLQRGVKPTPASAGNQHLGPGMRGRLDVGRLDIAGIEVPHHVTRGESPGAH